MIVPMKKATVIIQPKDADSAIRKMRSLEVLHVQHQKAVEGKDIKELSEDIELISQAIRILSTAKYSQKSSANQTKDVKAIDDWKFACRHIVDCNKRIEQLDDYSKGLEKTINEWEEWGDFNPQEIKSLDDKNIHIGLYKIPAKEMNNIAKDIIVEKLFFLKGFVGCAIISKDKIGLPFKELGLPRLGLNETRERLDENKQVIKTIKYALQKHLCYLEELIRIRISLEKELELNVAIKGMAEAEDIVYLTGFIPYDQAGLLLKTAKQEKWGVAIDDVSEDDKVPTLVRNPRWISILSPVFKALEIIPGYRELDISLWFLVFFSVFFGMLIGDVGYGAIYLLMTLLARRKLKNKLPDKSIFSLMSLLSICAIIWGFLSGTFFGQEWLPETFRPLLPALRSDRNVQAFCFLLGALHLSIARLWRMIIRFPSIAVLADAGWIFILWGAFFLAKMFVLKESFPEIGNYLFIAGIFLVIFFSQPTKNIVKSIGSGLGALLLNLVNNFTDIVSYVRLFAVGLATVAVADAFNKMAFSVGYNSLISGVISSLILLVGHTLNILLGPMSVLVHGIRLNVLEFSNHLDIKWSGLPYKPLKE